MHAGVEGSKNPIFGKRSTPIDEDLHPVAAALDDFTISDPRIASTVDEHICVYVRDKLRMNIVTPSSISYQKPSTMIVREPGVRDPRLRSPVNRYTHPLTVRD